MPARIYGSLKFADHDYVQITLHHQLYEFRVGSLPVVSSPSAFFLISAISFSVILKPHLVKGLIKNNDQITTVNAGITINR